MLLLRRCQRAAQVPGRIAFGPTARNGKLEHPTQMHQDPQGGDGGEGGGALGAGVGGAS